MSCWCVLPCPAILIPGLYWWRGGEDRALQECNPSAPQGAGKSNGVGSAAVPGRINPTTDRAPVSITQTCDPIFDRLGAGKNARAPARGGKSNGAGNAAVPGRINPTTDLAPVSIKQIGRPNMDRLGAGKNARAPARGGKSNGAGSAAVPGRINRTTDRAPVSITQTCDPIFDRLGAAKNRRAPADALEKATARGARPSPAASIRRPILHLFQSCKPGA